MLRLKIIIMSYPVKTTSMVSLENYYEKVPVSFSSESSGIRIKQLLDQVILRLPDEEQFGIVGEIPIDIRYALGQVLVDANLKYGLPSSP